MPRRKKGEPASTRTRTRNGCLTCRRRRVRCDEGTPKCFKCVKRGVACERGVELKWQTEYEELGIAFGRQGVWRKQVGDTPKGATVLPFLSVPIPLIKDCHFVNTTTDSADLALVSYETLRATCKSSGSKSSASPEHEVANQPVTYYQPSQWPDLESSWQGHLLQYYATRICPLTVASTASSSPFAALILPLAVSTSSNVLGGVLGLAATHLAQTDPTWRRRAYHLQCELLRYVRRKLQDQSRLQLASDVELPVIMVLLCLAEIIDRCDERWVAHLKGAKDLVALRRQMPTQNFPWNNISRFTESYFAYQDVIGRTACGELPVFNSTYWDANDRKVDPTLGCSPALISIVAQVTELSRQRRDVQSLDFEAKAAALEDELETLEQCIGSVADEALSLVLEIKTLAAHIVLHAALNDAQPDTPLICRLTSRILRIISSSTADSRAGYLWPLFVAAAELDPANDELCLESGDPESTSARRLVLEQLEAVAFRSLANVNRARQVITQIWDARDRAMIGDLDNTPGAGNDWEFFVAPVSSNISLA